MKARAVLGGVIVSIFGQATLLQAQAPDLKTPAPVIYLADNLDEERQLGWCIDTVGRGLSDRLHAHSCKPQGGDVQFKFDAATGWIASVAYFGKCAQYDGSLPLRLKDCDRSNEQKFSYDAKALTFHPTADVSLCLAVGAESQSAGPFMSRSLEVAECHDIDDALKSWVIAP